MLTIALVGCGKVADSHVEEISKQSNCRLMAVCDSEELMAEQLAVRYGVPSHFGDLDRMLATVRPDVLHITTPPQTHLDITRKAVDAGCHVYVEKPVALNLADTRKLLSCVRGAGKKITTGWRVNFDPPAVLLNELIAQGVIGEPVHVESTFGYDFAGPYGAAILANKDHWVRKLPGQLFHNNIDHLLNKMARFFGNEMPVIMAQSSCYLTGETSENALPDELRIMLKGRRITGFAKFSANSKPMTHTLTVYGTKDTVNVDYTSRTVTFAARPKMPSAIGRLLTAFDQGMQFHREGMRNVVRFLKSQYHFNAGSERLIALFYDSILNGTPPPISDEEILWVTGVMEEVFQQTSARVYSESALC